MLPQVELLLPCVYIKLPLGYIELPQYKHAITSCFWQSTSG